MKMDFTYNLNPIPFNGEETILRFCGIISYLSVYFTIGNCLMTGNGGYIEFCDEAGTVKILVKTSNVTFYDFESSAALKYLNGIRHEIYKVSQNYHVESDIDE